MAYSLAYLKFRKTLEREIRNYWSISIASEFSKEWLNGRDVTKKITQIADNKAPFSYVDIKGSDFATQLTTVVEHARENAIVNFITAFEVYLFEILSRIIFLNPDSLDDSEMKFDARDIVVGIKADNFKRWFSNRATDRTVRNKQHSEIIQRIAKISKCNITPIKSDIEEWNKWTYVRNAIVHTGRRVSSDLANIWPTKFPSVGDKLNIPNNELMKIQTLAMTIAKHLDKRANETIIQSHDSAVLTRELFARNGIQDVSRIKRILQKNLSYRAKTPEIQKELSIQRQTDGSITEINFDGIIEWLEMEE